MAHNLHASSPAPQRSNRPDLATDAIRTAREDLAACFRMAARNGFEEGICTHFSAVGPGHDDLFLVNPYGYAFRELTASKLLICDFHGNVLDGEGVPEATAFYIHAEMHKRLPRAKVAFHTHMPYATALTLRESGRLEMCEQNALAFYGRISYDDEYAGLALDSDEGDRLAARLGNGSALFLASHGIIVTAPTIQEATYKSASIDRACRLAYDVMLLGRDPLEIAPGLRHGMKKSLIERGTRSARLSHWPHLSSVDAPPTFDSRHEPGRLGARGRCL